MSGLREILQKRIASATLSVELSDTPKPELGDIAVPCFQFAKLFKKSPVDIAKELAPELKTHPIIDAVPSGPYVNLFLDPRWLAEHILNPAGAVLASPMPVDLTGKTLVVDYSSPNIAKHLGIHHLRSTMIGNAICNLWEDAGNKVVRLNYLGDWGTQFGVLLAACKKYGQRFDEQVTVDDLVNLYVQYSIEAKDTPELQEAARQEFQALEAETGLGSLQEGVSAPSFESWKLFREISLEEFKNIYQRLGVGPKGMTFQGESEFSLAAERVVNDALDLGVAVEGDGGAIIIPMGEGKPPCMLRKSDGATTYQSRDIAAAIAHYEKYSFDYKLYVVGHGQSTHFEQVFAALKIMGYGWAERCIHIPFGLMNLEGSKFSSREGKIVLLRDALDVAKEEVRNRVSENDFNIPETELDKIGIGAVVFADLASNRIKDTTFKWEDILRFEGSTGPYLQYTVVRCHSIRDKSRVALDKAGLLGEKDGYGLLSSSEEKGIMMMLDKWAISKQQATREYSPSVIAQYLLRLAKATNRYLHKCRVLQEDLSDSQQNQLQQRRTDLVEAVSEVLGSGLRLLGIKVPSAM